MITASQCSRICTNRPNFDLNNLSLAIEILKEKALAKKDSFDGTYIDAIRLMSVTGLKGVSEEVVKQYELQTTSEQDLLPDGAKTALQEIWLQNNVGFQDISLNEEDFALMKGKLMESLAIDTVNTLYKLTCSKNTQRITKGFLSGECDITYDTIIRDIKCPETWKTFKNKKGIESAYYWQLIAYCYLYNCNEAYIDYCLMPTPEELMDKITKYLNPSQYEKFLQTENAIQSLPLSQRVKSYKLEGNIQDDIEFLKRRLSKSEEYYNSLTYNICMNF